MVVLNSKPLQFKILKFVHNLSVIGYPAIGELCTNLSILNYKGLELRTTIFY